MHRAKKNMPSSTFSRICEKALRGVRAEGSPHQARATVANVDPRVHRPGKRNIQRAAHVNIHNVRNPVVRGETLDEEIVICLKQLRARLAAEVAQRLSPHVPGPAVYHDSEISGTVGQVQVEAGTSAW